MFIKTLNEMNRIKTFMLLLLFVASGYTVSAQNSKRPEGKTVKTAYYYQFEGAKSYDEVNALAKEVKALKGVTEFKPVFKPEGAVSQIIVVVTEKTRTSESEVLFEITDLKKILERKGYKNLNYTFEEVAVK